MPHMLQRMAIWAKNFKIAQIVILSVSIFMVYTQNFWLCIVAASVASCQQLSFQHIFSDGRKRRVPFAFSGFIDATFRAIFSFMRRRIQEFFSAMQTCVLSSTLAAHCFMKTFWRAILSFVSAASNMRKFCAAFLTIGCSLHSGSKCRTLPTTIFGRIFAVFRHRKLLAALRAFFVVFHSGASHATH